MLLNGFSSSIRLKPARMICLSSLCLASLALLYLSYGTSLPLPRLSKWTFGITTTSSLTRYPSSQSFAAELFPRLRKLEARPVLEHDEALIINSQTCNGTREQANQDQVRGSMNSWASAAPLFLTEKRAKLVERTLDFFSKASLNEISLKPPESPIEHPAWKELWGQGRGIVMTGGNQDSLGRILTCLTILREIYNSTLPVEIFSFPGEVRPSDPVRTKIEHLGNITFREVEIAQRPGEWKQFQIKGESLVRSRFSEILYLDSDNIPLRDPKFLFDSQVYKDHHRAVLWPDFNKDAAENPIWRTLGVKCKREHFEIESGQIPIDKRGQQGMNLAALVMAAQMQADSGFWHPLAGGDKDTFRYAFYALGVEYTPAPHWPSSAGRLVGEGKKQDFCGHTMLQYGLSSDEWKDLSLQTPSIPHAPPFSVHANLLKYTGIWRGSTWSHIKRVARDYVDAGNLPEMDRTRAGVYNDANGKMCVDMELVGEGEAEMIIEPWEEAWQGMMAGFEDMYFDVRTRSGGS